MPKNNNPAVPGSHSFVDPNASAADNRKILLDPATDLAIRRGQFLEIFHIPSGESIVFKAYIEGFQDKYDSTWNDADVYGRMDPIRQFAGTKRIISLDWIVPSYSVAEAKFNHNKCGLLFSMLYPNYDVGGVGGESSATQISTAPVFKVKFGNLIQDAAAPGGGVEDSGLVGAITGFVYEPNVEAGFIDDLREGYGTLYPKEVKLSMEYTVFHTHGLGWDGSKKRTRGFPYGDGTSASDAEAGAPDDMIEVIESAIGGIFGS